MRHVLYNEHSQFWCLLCENSSTDKFLQRYRAKLIVLRTRSRERRRTWCMGTKLNTSPKPKNLRILRFEILNTFILSEFWLYFKASIFGIKSPYHLLIHQSFYGSSVFVKWISVLSASIQSIWILVSVLERCVTPTIFMRRHSLSHIN